MNHRTGDEPLAKRTQSGWWATGVRPLTTMGIFLRLQRQDGIALIVALGVLVVLSIVGTTALAYSSSNSRSADRSTADELAFSLSEAALNNAMAVLTNRPANNPLDPDTLPSSEATAGSAAYERGTAKWWGVLDRNAAVWTITGVGLYRGPSGRGVEDVRRKLTARVPVVPVYTQTTEEHVAWNWLYARRTGNTCDITLNNAISGSARFYVAGNLCLSNAVNIANGPLIVRGNLDLAHKDASVGAATSMDTRVETYVGGNCKYHNGTWAVPCTGNQDARKIFSKRDPPSFGEGVNNDAPFVPEPVANFGLWYENAIPGPSQSCTTVSGTPPVFDTNYPLRDNTAPLFDLTPAASYTCRVGPASNPSGELSWDALTRVLTIRGTVYIDGSVRSANSQVNSYNGQGALYLSGTFTLDADTKLCGSVSGADCDFASWNPNTRMLTIAANGSDASGYGVVVNARSSFQGALYATSNVYLNNRVKVDGPVVGNTLVINNDVNADAFPTINTVPVGMPGEETIFAQPNPPELFSG